jgi:hypothetical protein
VSNILLLYIICFDLLVGSYSRFCSECGRFVDIEMDSVF